jgi:hypothetical protein
MLVLAEALRWAAAAALGIYAGAMLTEGGVLVPFWRGLAPAEFLRWYAANARRLNAFFGALTVAALVASVLAAAASLWEGHPGRGSAVAAAGVMVGLLAAYFAYFERANASFAQATIAVDAVPAALARWRRWHDVRMVCSVAAFAAALSAVRAAGR